METVHHDYAPLGVQFYYVYKALAHPSTNNYVSPVTIDERLQHIQIFERETRSRIKWLADTMSNDVKHALGDAPNSEYIIDPAGKVIRKRRWSDPDQLRKDLEQLVGPSPEVTKVEALNVRRVQPAKQAAKGVAPRLRLPGQMTPVVVNADLDGAGLPFYVKLRAEADDDLLRRGKGLLYLGFFLDPIYEVHWNNQAGQMSYEIEGLNGVSASPASGQGPKVDAPADSDPREFLIEVTASNDAANLRVTAHYTACDDAETFCKPASQTFHVTLERDRDGGSRRSGRARWGGRASGLESASRAERLRRRLLSYDRDRDGMVALDDLPPLMQLVLTLEDQDEDGFLNQQEIRAIRPMGERRSGDRLSPGRQ